MPQEGSNVMNEQVEGQSVQYQAQSKALPLKAIIKKSPVVVVGKDIREALETSSEEAGLESMEKVVRVPTRTVDDDPRDPQGIWGAGP